MIIAIIFGAIVGQLSISTATFQDCKERNFEPKACKITKYVSGSSSSDSAQK